MATTWRLLFFATLYTRGGVHPLPESFIQWVCRFCLNPNVGRQREAARVYRIDLRKSKVWTVLWAAMVWLPEAPAFHSVASVSLDHVSCSVDAMTSGNANERVCPRTTVEVGVTVAVADLLLVAHGTIVNIGGTIKRLPKVLMSCTRGS